MTDFRPPKAAPNSQPAQHADHAHSRLLPKGTIWILLLLSTVTLCLALISISWRAADLARDELQTEITEKAEIEARALGEKIEKALHLGIPLRGIVGFESVVDKLRDGDPDLVFAAVTNNQNDVLHAGGLTGDEIGRALAVATPSPDDTPYIVTRLALTHDNDHEDIAIVLGHTRAALMRPVTDNLFDIAIIFIITLALSFELMLLVLTVNVALPVRVARKVLGNVRDRKFTLLHGQSTHDEIGQFMERINAVIKNTASKIGTHPETEREVRLIGVRMLAFMFVLAEELARPIMPSFFSQVTSSSLDGQLGAGVVMAVHLLMVALAMPICSLFQERVGSLRMYLCGAFLATLGLFGTAFAAGIWDLVLWRALSGIGYATTFVACQSYVLNATNSSNRTQGTAMMVSGIMLADICGPAIGGIVAGHFGPDTTFLGGAAIASLAVALAFFLMDNMVRGKTPPPIPTKAALKAMLGNRRLQVLILFAAMPAKLILSGFLYYLTPIILLQSGATTAETGRVIMLYGLVAILTGWFIAKWTDKSQNETRAVGIGGGLTAAGLLLAGWMPEYATFAVAVAVLGLAQATSIPAQLSASLKLSKDFTGQHGTGPVLAVLRLTERLGGAIGPLLAAGLTLWVGTTQAVWILGAFAAVSVLCFELLIGHVPAEQKDEGTVK
ncbi:MFS transporter [Thalassospira alkalitolerans]|uniref:MFS transporter n=1 Tax=Thalassospira alkalitolerans TaxID=1293890 RepID=UPI0030EC57CB|tara:strand:- start:93296 stop:95308 length:2013 start_codon:yes stop_codon:yes gene_type:complete